MNKYTRTHAYTHTSKDSHRHNTTYMNWPYTYSITDNCVFTNPAAQNCTNIQQIHTHM